MEENGQLYSWTGTRWELGFNEFVRFISVTGVNLLEDIREKAREELDKTNPVLGMIETTIHLALKEFKNRPNQLKIIESSEAFLTREDVEFDSNTEIIGFYNGVYDLVKSDLRNIMITLLCHVDMIILIVLTLLNYRK
jgi:D5 N terminal like